MQKNTLLLTKYEPQSVENKIYKFWEENNCFLADVNATGEPYTIVMPPPNVTGQLHLGHAMDNTLQDILIRWKRMQGFNTLWVPGTDHAGIATQVKVEESLAADGLTKFDLGREKFIEKTWEWKDKYHGRIVKQLKSLGCSCDWTRERFTMDEGCSKAVREVFVRLYEKGLIHRGKYIVNWCSKCHTTISDIEVEHKDVESGLWYLSYPVKNSKENLVVATTRPETMLGDTAVAVNPKDERYSKLIGQRIILPIVGREIPIIADDYVEQNFGTGAVKITPAHDQNDFEISLRHQLDEVVVIDKNGKMNENAGKYEGLSTIECRVEILKELKSLNVLVKEEVFNHSVGHCYRCDTIIEPYVSNQWFVKMELLAKPAINAVVEGKTRFVPERFNQVYLSWLENIRDWCISRQLWWGHRIPVWYCQDCGEMICSRLTPTVCIKCESTNLEQDQDVLDTWFSSGLWPFSTLGWPENTAELNTYYPNSVLVTGRDIIFFWVARMMFLSLEFMGKVPYSEVFIHGLILDAQGRKMSKSLGNGIDPIEIIDNYGADILRFMLVTGNTPGNDLKFQMDRLDGVRNFANKVWNAARFVIMNLEDYDSSLAKNDYSLADNWILGRLSDTITNVTVALDNYELGEAAKLVYEFTWNNFCDWYIELVKTRLFGKESEESRRTAQAVCLKVLRTTMQLLHPFMPFITEEIWQYLPHGENSIMKSIWPKAELNFEHLEIQKSMEEIMETIRSIRNIRAEMGIIVSKKITILFYCKNENVQKSFELNVNYFKQLAGVETIEFIRKDDMRLSTSGSAVLSHVEIFVPLGGAVDLQLEINRLEKELKQLTDEKNRIINKLNDDNFVAKAPEIVIQKEKAKLIDYSEKYIFVAKRLEEYKAVYIEG
ncbi:MAG: valine--tRNA ligase [Clostridia bacterium]